MKEIPLTRGFVALVDDEDYDDISQFKWCAHVESHTVYAKRLAMRGRVCGAERMHRRITNAPAGVLVDHKDGNGLNNTRANLRLCSALENNKNARKRVSNKSGFIGVSWYKASNRWVAQVNIKGKRKHLGCFKTPDAAAIARDAAVVEHYGDYAQLNFPNEEMTALAGLDETVYSRFEPYDIWEHGPE